VLENTSLVFSGHFFFVSSRQILYGPSIGKYEQQLKPEVVPYFISLSSKDFIRYRQPAPFPLSLDLLLLALL